MSLKLKYFVLNPTSSDEAFAKASRAAMRAFAASIAETDKDLANDLRNWADSCSPALSPPDFADWPDEKRIEAIGQNSNEGLHYNDIDPDWPKP